MGYRNISRRSREQATRNNEKKPQGSGFNFRSYPITLQPDDCGVFQPMRTEAGDFVEDDVKGHKVDGWDRSCTANIDGFDGHCCYCDVGSDVIPDHTGEGVQTAIFKMIGVWDMNWWVPRINADGKQLKSKEIYLLGPDEQPPTGAEYGGARFFKMGQNRINSFYEYAGELEDVCQCVINTNDERVSRCFVTEVRCPRCGFTIYSDRDLAKYRKPSQIRSKILDTLHKCASKEDGGCWSYDDEQKGIDAMFLPDPVFACQNDLNNGNCDGANPCHPYLGPALVTRVGEGVGTTYRWERDSSLEWAEWVDFELPNEAYESFAKGMDFADRMGRVMTLAEQAKELGIQYPYDPQTKSYGPRRRPRKTDTEGRRESRRSGGNKGGQRRQSSAGGRGRGHRS